MTWKIVKTVGKSDLVRPNFAPGLLLEDDDLTLIVNYGRSTLQTLLRAMLGGGVLCGLRVTAAFDTCKQLTITVACGTALDCHGRVIEMSNTQTIKIENDCCNALPPTLYLSLLPADTPCAPRELTGTALEGEGETAFTRIREGWQIQITDTRPESACGCPENDSDCYASHNNGECGCDCDCNGVLLAKLSITDPTGNPSVSVNHGVRRFVRPALLPDPLAPSAEQETDDATQTESETVRMTGQTPNATHTTSKGDLAQSGAATSAGGETTVLETSATTDSSKANRARKSTK
ncbi:MAG: hypothetical protein HYZ45_08255 [Burkholderiales bacterium]|nr:hypothetical protein [Burkholderiales bacterium]